MTREDLRRRLLWHGYLNFFVGLLLGIPIAVGWHARAWLTIHVPQITSALAVVVLGLLWRDLRLTEAKLVRLFRLTLGSIYLGLAVGLFNGIVEFPGPISAPGVAPPGWQVMVSAPVGLVAIGMLFWSVVMTLRGLGGSPEA